MGRPDAGRPTRAVRELAFLHEIAQLATLARDWDELMRSIVDGTTAAMGVEVCSFYLADHEKTRLTLAATNGLDRTQVGKVSLAWGEGITGRVAATPQPIAVEDVTQDDRFSWVRGFDIEASPGCCRCRSSGTTRSWASSTSRPATSAGSSRRESTSSRRSPRCSRDRREGPPDGRGRGAARPADGLDAAGRSCSAS
jgi:hypothetical protein